MSNFFSAPSTPAKTDSERTTTTPSTGKTEINSPYDYEKQVDFEWDNRNKRKRNVVDVGVVGETPSTVMTDRYSRPIFTKENGVLVEVTTKTANGGLYFYEDGNPVPYSNLNIMKRDLSADFDLMKKPRTGGKRRKSRKAVKRAKRRKTMKKRKNKRKY